MEELRPLYAPLAASYRSAQTESAAPRRPLPAGLRLAAADYTAILLIPAVACFCTATAQNLQRNLLFWNLLAAVTLALTASHGGYRMDASRQAGRSAKLAIRHYIATAVAMLAVAVMLGHAHAVSPFWTAAELILTPIFLLSARSALALQARQAARTATAGPVVVCFDRSPGELRRALAEQRIFANISGILYLSPTAETAAGIPIIPDVPGLLETIRARHIQDIIFLYQPELEAIPAATRQALLAELLPYPARIWMAFDLKPQLPNMLANRSGCYRLVPLVTDELITAANPTKRIFDVAVSLLLLLLTLPLLLGIAALVHATSPGPIVFRQLRTGAHGRRFTVLKFRTMHHHATAPFAQATANDRRVTRIGRFLRRSSLDELLQLVNVLRGDMSLVGPRPHAPETQVQGISFEDAVKLYRLRYRVRPGITGLAQIRGQRGATLALETLEQRIGSDLEYIERWSLGLDLLILLRTLQVFIKPKNAV